MFRQILIFASLLALCFFAHGQSVTVINNYGDTTGMGPDQGFRLRDTQQHMLIINYYEPADTTQADRLTELINGALAFYIDQAFVIGSSSIDLRKNKKTMLREMQDIVVEGVEYYDYREIEPFAGFSALVDQKIEEIDRTKLNKVSDIEKPTLVRYHLEGLKMLAFAEVNRFAVDNLLVKTETTTEVIDEASQEMLLQELRDFQTHDELNTLKFNLSNATVTLLASEDEFILPDYQEPDTAEQDDFAQQVLAMLKENSEQLNSLKSEVDEIRREQERERKQQETNLALQGQINELREMIVQLVNGQTPITTTNPDKPVVERPRIDNLPPSVTVTFGSGSSQVNGAGQLVISEIIDLLAHHPEMRIMITGYADQQGNASTNLQLSQKRAQQVRALISRSGIASDRMIMNYFGDSQASGVSQSDRKVVIEFLY
ncbi:MAG: OmpA family protein [Flavobacteriales bacterium]|nr:OmpA family protein [Flavobacteriales bacterium]